MLHLYHHSLETTKIQDSVMMHKVPFVPDPEISIKITRVVLRGPNYPKTSEKSSSDLAAEYLGSPFNLQPNPEFCDRSITLYENVQFL